jgi:hypothetical protein
MKPTLSKNRGWISLAVVAIALLGWPAHAVAQTAGGQAEAVHATVLGATTVLSDTGVLPAGTSGALDASSPSGTVPSLLSGDSLSAATIGSPDRIDSEASLGSLGMTVAGNTISADFLMAQASQVTGSSGAGAAEVDGLTINGISIPVSGAPNQTIPVLGGVVVVNEQRLGSTGALVNALHVILSGVADVVLASATAGTPPSSSSGGALPLAPITGLL